MTPSVSVADDSATLRRDGIVGKRGAVPGAGTANCTRKTFAASSIS